MRPSRGRPPTRWPRMAREVGRPVSQNDVQWWSLVIGLGVFVTIVLIAFVGRRIRERRDSSTAPTRAGAQGGSSSTLMPGRPGPADSMLDASDRPAGAASQVDPPELASAVRSSILRAVAERVPTGWTALVLSPPPHPERMTWHVHLAPEVGLDLRDGRTVHVATPAPSHEWQVPGGRTVAVSAGDPVPAPGSETVSVRVTGPYLVVSASQEGGGSPLLVARVVQASGDDLPQPRATSTDLRAARAALREAIELTIGSRMTGSPPAVGYPIASWTGHDRTWLTVRR
jgi:hypothetical protein